MEWVICAALCSVAVSIYIKQLKQRGYEVLNLIAWNYLAAVILCVLWFKPDFAQVHVTDIPWLNIAALGVLLPSVFVCLAYALGSAGMMRTEISQRLSVILSLVAAFLLFQEIWVWTKGVAFVLGIAAMLCLVAGRHTNVGGQSRAHLWLLLVWGGYAVIDILLKFTSQLGLKLPITLTLIFSAAFILSQIYLFVRRQQRFSGSYIAAGLGLGVLNFMNIAFYLKGHIALKTSPALVFAGMNILVVLFGVLAGRILYKEPFNRRMIIGFVFAVASLLLLAWHL